MYNFPIDESALYVEQPAAQVWYFLVQNSNTQAAVSFTIVARSEGK